LTAGDGGGSPTIQDLLDGMDWMITLFATHFLQGEACSLSSSPPPDNADLMWASRRGAACRHMQVDNTHFFFFSRIKKRYPVLCAERAMDHHISSFVSRATCGARTTAAAAACFQTEEASRHHHPSKRRRPQNQPPFRGLPPLLKNTQKSGPGNP
jgi:hypothetical protein